VQPIEHKEVLPEQHTHNLAPQVEKTFVHGDIEQDKEKHAANLAQFQDTRTVEETTQSTAAASSVAGEHVHHHVHEVVQPVIHKETIQPEFVHTTIPIHEKVTAPSEHHGLSTLPVKTLEEFKATGTDLTAKHHSHHEYEGHPRPYNAEFQEERKPVDIDPRAHDGTHDLEATGHTPSRPSTSTGTEVTSGTTTTGSTGHGNSAAMGSGVAGVAAGSVARDLGSDHTRAGQNTDLNPKDSSGPIGDSGVGTAGTSLGGRTEGNTVSGATDSLTSSRKEETKEPTNLVGGTAGSNIKDDTVQHASQIGEDPSLVTSSEIKAGKLTGSGADGSHSAVFGLTPDGHKFNDTKSSIGKSLVHSEGGSGEKGTSKDKEDTGSRGVGTGEVAEQMHDPKVAEKGHEGQASYGDDNNKPGAGTSLP
jgi:hypothetical protein